MKESMMFMSGGREMSSLMLELDWSRSALGSPETWPQSLKTTLNILLRSHTPMLLCWGKELICFYNESYSLLLQKASRPHYLGESARAQEPLWNLNGSTIEEVMKTGKTILVEDKFIPVEREGKIENILWTFNYSAVLDESEKPAGVLLICNELTEKLEWVEQKVVANELKLQLQQRVDELEKVNAALLKSEERYHSMVEEVQDYAIFYLNTEGIIENWNKGVEKIKGYKEDEIVGKHFSIFYPKEYRDDLMPARLLSEAKKNGKAMQEGWRVRKDGSKFWASVVITALHDDVGNVIGFSKVTHDVTSKMEADKKIKLHAELLAQKNRELEKINSELQSFAYVASHDLQEPIRKIQTFASRLLEKEKDHLSDTAKDYFRRMQDAAGRMQVLIMDLLAYSRTTSGERVFVRLDLRSVIDDVKIELREMVLEKNATIEMESSCEVNVIEFQFRQLMNNLISNSLKFSKEGVAPHVRISCEMVNANEVENMLLLPDKKYCHISVTDNGIGFEPEYSERIFEVFQRLHGREVYKGTGIGLAIVKKIVENHFGVISATSELGEGARFDIYFPA